MNILLPLIVVALIIAVGVVVSKSFNKKVGDEIDKIADKIK